MRRVLGVRGVWCGGGGGAEGAEGAKGADAFLATIPARNGSSSPFIFLSGINRFTF